MAIDFVSAIKKSKEELIGIIIGGFLAFFIPTLLLNQIMITSILGWFGVGLVLVYAFLLGNKSKERNISFPELIIITCFAGVIVGVFFYIIESGKILLLSTSLVFGSIIIPILLLSLIGRFLKR